MNLKIGAVITGLLIAVVSQAHVAHAVTLEPGDIVIATQIGPAANGDRGLLLVDPVTGDRTILSDNSIGTGPGFANPAGVAFAPDGEILVTDLGSGPNGPGSVFRVDPTTGDRTIVSSSGVGAGATMDLPYGILESGNSIYVADSGTASILAIDPATGNRAVISGTSVGTGTAFAEPIGLALQGSTLLATDYSSGAVVRVDLATGNRDWGPQGTFPAYPQFAGSLAIGPTGTIYVSGQIDGANPNAYAGVFAQDPATHLYSMLSTNIAGTGPQFMNTDPTGIATEIDGRILLNMPTSNAVLTVDPVTGNRAILSDSGHGLGPIFRDPQGIAVVPSVPEPASIALLAIGAIGLGAIRRQTRGRV